MGSDSGSRGAWPFLVGQVPLQARRSKVLGRSLPHPQPFDPQLVVGPKKKYKGTSLIRKRTLLGPCRRPMPRVLGGS